MNYLNADAYRSFLEEQIRQASTIEEKKLFMEEYSKLRQNQHDYDMALSQCRTREIESYNSAVSAQNSNNSNMFIAGLHYDAENRRNYFNGHFETIRHGLSTIPVDYLLTRS